MSHSFGWWDFAEGAQPALVNRYSGERIVRHGPLEPGEAPADEPWLRFDYLADDLTYPLAVKWAPERGEIVLDHNVSAAIWRRETQAAAAKPPFGTFVRVDDIVPDALWCWPGVIDLHFERLVDQSTADPSPAFHRGESPLTLFRLGGYCNGAWHDRLVCEETNDVHFSPLEQGRMGRLWNSSADNPFREMVWRHDFEAAYTRARQYERRFYLAPNASALSPLVFVDPMADPDLGDDYPNWMRQVLTADPPSRDPYWRTNTPAIPHAVSLDRTRLIAHPGTHVMCKHASEIVWTLLLHHRGRKLAETKVVPSRKNWFGPYAGGRYQRETFWVCGLDAMSMARVPEASEIVHVGHSDERLDSMSEDNPLSRAIDLSLQQRDLTDALFLFTAVVDRGFAHVEGLKRPSSGEQRFECVASPAKLLGGRVVGSRVAFTYFASI